MKPKYLLYTVLSVLFLIFSYLPYSYLMVWLSFVLIFPSVIVFVVTLYKGRAWPLHRLLGHMAMLNWLFVGCVWVFNFIVFSVLKFNNTDNVIVYFGSLASLLLVWYLQVSLFFIKPKIEPMQTIKTN